MRKKGTVLVLLTSFTIASLLFTTCFVEFDPPAVNGPYVDGSGKRVSGVTSGSAQGYGGQVSVTLLLNGGYIENAVVAGAKESPGYGADAVAAAGNIIIVTNSVELDTISGSTITTRAIKEAGRAALDKLGAIATGPGSNSGAVSGSGTYGGLWYVSNFWSDDVHIIDGKTLKIVKRINFSSRSTPSHQSHFLCIDKDEKHLWVGQIKGNLWVYNLETEEIEKTWTAADMSSNTAPADIGLVQDREGKYLFSPGSRHIHIFDMEALEYVNSIVHLAPGSTNLQSDNPHVLEVSYDNETLWTCDYNGGKVQAYDITVLPNAVPPLKYEFDIYDQIKDGFIGVVGTNTNAQIPQLLGHALAIHPNEKYLFLGSFQGNAMWGCGTYVIGIDPAAAAAFGKVLHRVPGRPHNYDISPDGSTLLVCDNNEALFQTVRGTRVFTEFNEHLDELGYDVAKMNNTFLTYTIDISSLKDVPDWSTVGITNVYATTGVGRSNHAIYSPDGTEFHVTYDGVPSTTGAGTFRTYKVNNTFTPKVITPSSVLPIGLQPHAIAVPGFVR
ncbi:MAG: FMN-binding protein [Treponema sp.]|nr:FMN-binding protein [Treponema sp.]